MSQNRPASRTQRAPNPAVAEVLADIRTLVSALGRSARAVEQGTGISNAQLFLLRELAAADGLTINELAARAMTSQSTVSLLVTRLETAGFVRRARAKTDARRVRVVLTRQGAAVAERAPEPPTGQLIGALERLTKRELSDLARSLGALLAQLNLATPDAVPLFEDLPPESDRTTRRPR